MSYDKLLSFISHLSFLSAGCIFSFWPYQFFQVWRHQSVREVDLIFHVRYYALYYQNTYETSCARYPRLE